MYNFFSFIFVSIYIYILINLNDLGWVHFGFIINRFRDVKTYETEEKTIKQRFFWVIELLNEIIDGEKKIVRFSRIAT